MKTGIIDAGGGLRGIYAAGIFDYCMDTGIRYDLCIGVSAGSANIASYLAGREDGITNSIPNIRFEKSTWDWGILSLKRLILIWTIYMEL